MNFVPLSFHNIFFFNFACCVRDLLTSHTFEIFEFYNIRSENILEFIFQVKEIPVPEIEEDEILVNLEYSGICHTDVHCHEGIYGPLVK